MFETLPNYFIDVSEEVFEAARILMTMHYHHVEFFSKKVAIHHEVSSTPSLSSQQVSLPHQEPLHQKPSKHKKAKEKHHEKQLKKVKRNYTKRKRVEEDNTKETLRFVKAWNKHKLDPKEKIDVVADVAEWFSEPIKKQVTESDVKKGQNRLMLGKLQVQEKFLTLLKDSDDIVDLRGLNGLDVLVYGPEGEAHEMKFKMWDKDTPVLTCGWNKFVEKNGLEVYCDFLTIWMFRHMKTRKICFAIHKQRLPITNPLSKCILKEIT